jgi:hypothetical protein
VESAIPHAAARAVSMNVTPKRPTGMTVTSIMTAASSPQPLSSTSTSALAFDQSPTVVSLVESGYQAAHDFECSPVAVKRLAERYLHALNTKNVTDLLDLFIPDPTASSSHRDSGPEIYSTAVQRRWGIADAHLSGRSAMRKHFEKGFDASNIITASSNSDSSSAPSLSRLGSRSTAPAPLVSGDDAYLRATFIALLPGPTKWNWTLVYERSDAFLVNNRVGLSTPQLVVESLDLSEDGRIRCVRVSQGDLPTTMMQPSGIQVPNGAVIAAEFNRTSSLPLPSSTSASSSRRASLSHVASVYEDEEEYARAEPHYAFAPEEEVTNGVMRDVRPPTSPTQQSGVATAEGDSVSGFHRRTGSMSYFLTDEHGRVEEKQHQLQQENGANDAEAGGDADHDEEEAEDEASEEVTDSRAYARRY